MNEGSNKLRFLIRPQSLIVLALVIVYAGAATYYAMGETSVRGLTVKMFSVSRFCTNDSGISDKVVTYNIQTSVWSATSLRTALSGVKFTLSVDGREAGTSNQGTVSFDPGNSASFSLTIDDPGGIPSSLPQSSDLVLTITATVSAGLASATLTRSDSLLQNFGATSC